MNWDTKEISMIIESNETYYTALKEHGVGNELYFMVMLYVIIQNENSTEMRIDPAKVNGNEVYVSFCEAAGNETKGWCS